MKLLICQRGGIRQSLLDVVRLDVRVFLDDLFRCHSIRYEVYEQGDGDTKAPDARASGHDAGSECNSIEHRMDDMRLSP